MDIKSDRISLIKCHFEQCVLFNKKLNEDSAADTGKLSLNPKLQQSCSHGSSVA